LNIAYFLQGYVFGFSVATTIGISGVLTLQNMMTGRFIVGFASALASASGDMLCGLFVVFGLQTVQSVVMAYRSLATTIAGLFLCFLGIQKLFSKVVLDVHQSENRQFIRAFLSVLFLSLLDPVSILDFMAICLALTLDFSIVNDCIYFTVGLFLGSATWWFSLFVIILYFRNKISVELLQKIQQIIGAGIFGLGIWTISGIWR